MGENLLPFTNLKANKFQQKNQNNSITEKHTPTLFNLLHKVMFFLHFTQKIKKKKS